MNINDTIILENTHPNDIQSCDTTQLITIIKESIIQHKSISFYHDNSNDDRKKICETSLINYIISNNIDGQRFNELSNKDLAKLIDNDVDLIEDIRYSIISYFASLGISMPKVNNNDGNNLFIRYVLVLNNETHAVNPLTMIGKNSNYDYCGFPLTSKKYIYLIQYMLRNCDVIIYDDVMKIIIAYIGNKSFVGVCFVENILNKPEINKIYNYFSKMDKKLNDIRARKPMPDYYRNWGPKFAEIHDIIDPSLFVKDVSNPQKSKSKSKWIPSLFGKKTNNNNTKKSKYTYQWIPSKIKVTKTKPCKVKILSSINTFKRNNNKELFNIYEDIIGKMLPLFEDVIQQKLVVKKKELQIICKAIQYNAKNNEYYATIWHNEGKNIENIVAVGVLYTRNDFITEYKYKGNLAFSMASHDYYSYFGGYDDLNKPQTGKGDHFGIETKAGRCIVWNNKYLKHRLDIIKNDDENTKIRQVIICMLVDPNDKIEYPNKDDYKISLKDAKKRRKLDRNERQPDQRGVCHTISIYFIYENKYHSHKYRLVVVGIVVHGIVVLSDFYGIFTYYIASELIII